MNIVFYNTFAVGDLYFNQPFLKHICDSNPSQHFHLHINYGSFFYKDIPNLHALDESDGPLDSPLRYKNFKFFEQFSKCLFVKAEPNLLFVNTWVGVLNDLINPLSCECNPQNLYLAYTKLVSEINTMLPVKLAFPPMQKIDFVYKMPVFDIKKFLTLQKDSNREFLFYFNRLGMSASTKPFSTEEDHKQILIALSSLYPEKYIVVPNAAILPDCPNILPISLFGVRETQTCENVLLDMEIAGHCTYAVLFDIGAAYTYCNSRFGTYTAKFYHLSKDPRFYCLAKEALETCLEVDTSNVEYVSCETPIEVITQLQKRFL